MPDGLKVELFAAEPLLANPAAFSIDEKGVAYVAETFRLNEGVIAATCPDLPPRLGAVVTPTPIGRADRVLTPVLVVSELHSWGVAFTSLGLLLATWTPRIGRAIGVSLAVFLLLSFGWISLAGIVILPELHAWLYSHHNLEGIDLIWIDAGLMLLSPMAAPSRPSRRWTAPRRPLAVLGHHVLLVPARGPSPEHPTGWCYVP